MLPRLWVPELSEPSGTMIAADKLLMSTEHTCSTRIAALCMDFVLNSYGMSLSSLCSHLELIFPAVRTVSQLLYQCVVIKHNQLRIYTEMLSSAQLPR